MPQSGLITLQSGPKKQRTYALLLIKERIHKENLNKIKSRRLELKKFGDHIFVKALEKAEIHIYISENTPLTPKELYETRELINNIYNQLQKVVSGKGISPKHKKISKEEIRDLNVKINNALNNLDKRIRNYTIDFFKLVGKETERRERK